MRATWVAGKQGASCGQTSLERDHVAVSPRAESVSTIGPLMVIPILTSGMDGGTIYGSRAQCVRVKINTLLRCAPCLSDILKLFY
jgi:hypothetical protein